MSAVPATVPVTVKHRSGWDELHKNAPEFASAMVEAGARMITVHGRTRTQGFSGESELAVIRRVRDVVPAQIPVVGNGDVVDVASYLRMRGETGCDAVMIGRGALGNPWLFRSVREVAAGRGDPGAPDIAERLRVFRRHVELLRKLRGGPKLIHEIRKASAWYAKGLRGANSLRQRIWKLAEAGQVVRLVEDHFESLRSDAHSAAA
jgi:nifR3 family TIM-barrel protein